MRQPNTRRLDARSTESSRWNCVRTKRGAIWRDHTCKRSGSANNVYDDPLLRMSQVPVLDIHLVAGDHMPGRFGDVASRPVIPAQVNAIFLATGKRIRELPMHKSGFELA